MVDIGGPRGAKSRRPCFIEEREDRVVGIGAARVAPTVSEQRQCHTVEQENQWRNSAKGEGGKGIFTSSVRNRAFLPVLYPASEPCQSCAREIRPEPFAPLQEKAYARATRPFRCGIAWNTHSY